jgi:hypothetical protein
MSQVLKDTHTLGGKALAFFLLAISGFSFWFFVAVPFASHRESYWWLAKVLHLPVTTALGSISTTWRPLAQITTWLGFVALDPGIFPTSVFRQVVLQTTVYLFFVLAWGIIYSVVRERKIFSIVALTAGGVFFSPYIHLFHIYGAFYVPVLLTLSVMLWFHTRDLGKAEGVLILLAIVLAFWHPFAPAIFLAFYFGRYLDTWRSLSSRQHVKVWGILITVTSIVLTLLVLSPRTNQQLNAMGFLASYQTNEVNSVASVVAWILALITVMSVSLRPWAKLIGLFVVVVSGVVLLTVQVPLLLLWMSAALFKLVHLRNWRLFIPMLVAFALPYGGGLGGPMYGLFAIILAVLVTSLGWVTAEVALSILRPIHVLAFVAVLCVTIAILRSGTTVPVVSRLARPLFVERERTYQLENTLSWLASSRYCSYDIRFAKQGGDPVDDVENAISRQNRPPTTIADAGLFWNTVLRCNEQATRPNGIITITFGEDQAENGERVFELPSPNAGPIKAWLSYQ